MMNATAGYLKSLLLPALLLLFTATRIKAQQTKNLNLVTLLRKHKLITSPARQTRLLDDPQKAAITTQGVVWLSGVRFTDGALDIDLRGKDVFLQSFLGLAFHATDSATYDVVYFRPFNFRHADTLRRKWSVQYMSLPGHDYAVLRNEHPLVYENAVTPVPQADEWFHATIVIKGDWITVYVNHSTEPSLRVKKINTIHTGNIGLWADGLSGDFANLSITQ